MWTDHARRLERERDQWRLCAERLVAALRDELRFLDHPEEMSRDALGLFDRLKTPTQ
jgi:hypothetical protein